MNSAAPFYVYILFRLDGRPCYVGKGKGDRWKRHQGRAKHYNRRLGSIIDQARKEGLELPREKVAVDLTEEAAFALERKLIAQIGRAPNGPLVNLMDGGDGPSGYKPSPELIELIAAKRRGKKHTVEHRARISAALKGRKKSPEHVASAAAGQRGRSKKSGWWSTAEGRAKQAANNHSRLGIPHSDEAREKIREKRMLQKNVSQAAYFKRGQSPWNKGVKGLQLSSRTQFQKGYQPSDEVRARLSAAVKASWDRRKAAAEISSESSAGD